MSASFARRAIRLCPDCPFPARRTVLNKDVSTALKISAAALSMRKRRARIRRDGRRRMRLCDVCKIC